MAKPNNDGALPHEADYRPLEDQLLRGVSKEHVLRMAANVLVQCFELDVLRAIVAAGYDEFHAVARPIWHVHDFTDDDYRKAFEVVQAALKARGSRVDGVTTH